MRHRAALVLLPALVLLVGCAPSPAPTTPEASPPPSIAVTPPAPPAPETSTAPTAPGVSDFATAELVELCIERTRELAPDATYHADRAITEWLAPVSSWFVVVPKELGGQESAAVCGIRGDASSPIFEMNGETLLDGIDQARADLLAVNDGG